MRFPLAATLAGSGRRGRVDGRRSGAQFDAPSGVLALPSGELLVVDGDALRVVSLVRDAVYTLATRTTLLHPGGLALIDDGAGLVVADTGHHRLRLLALARDAHSGELRVADDVCLAGTGKPGLADGPAAEAAFCRPAGLAVIADGSILVADSGSHAVRRLSGRPGLPGLHVSTVVGGGGPGFVDGGPGTARLRRPGALAVDAASGTVFVCDAGNRAVRALHPPRDDALLSGTPARELPLGSWALTTLGAVGVLREPVGLLLLPAGGGWAGAGANSAGGWGGELLVADAARNALLQLLRREPPPPPSGAVAALHAAGAADAACLVLRVDEHACEEEDAAARPAAAAATRRPLHSSVVLPPSTVLAAVGARGPPRPAATARAAGTSPAALLVAALRGELWGHDAQPPPPPPPFLAVGDAATGAVQQLQAQLRAHVVAYHDVAAVAAVHAHWGGRWVRAAGQPQQPQQPQQQQHLTTALVGGGDGSGSDELRGEGEARGDTGLMGGGDSEPQRSAAAAAAAAAAGRASLPPSPFVRARSTSAASSSRLASFYADGLTRSEARFRRPGGMCALTAEGGLVAVCDTANCMLRLLVHRDALRAVGGGGAAPSPLPLVARLVPQPLLARGAAAVAASDAAERRGVELECSLLLASSFLDASFLSGASVVAPPQLEQGEFDSEWNAATATTPPALAAASRQRPQVPPLSSRAPLAPPQRRPPAGSSSSSSSARATPRAVPNPEAAVHHVPTAAATAAPLPPVHVGGGLLRGRDGEGHSGSAPTPPHHHIAEGRVVASSSTGRGAAGTAAGCDSLHDLAALSLDELRRPGGDVRGHAGAGSPSSPQVRSASPQAALLVTRSPPASPPPPASATSPSTPCCFPSWTGSGELLPLPPPTLSAATGGVAAKSEVAEGRAAPAAPCDLRPHTIPPPAAVAAPRRLATTTPSLPPPPAPPAVDAFAMASLLSDLRHDLSPELSAQLRELLLAGGDCGGSGDGIATFAVRSGEGGLRVRHNNDVALGGAAVPCGGVTEWAHPPASQPPRPPPQRRPAGFVEVSERVSRWARRGLPTQPQLASSLHRRSSSPPAGVARCAALSYASAHEFDASMALTPARATTSHPRERTARAPSSERRTSPPPPPPRSRAGSFLCPSRNGNGLLPATPLRGV